MSVALSVVIYFSAYGATALLYSLLFRIKAGRFSKYFLIAIAALPFSLLAGFRDNVGTDYLNYAKIFEEFRTTKLVDLITASDNIEVGYYLLIRAIQFLGADVHFAFFAYEFFIIYIFLLGLSKYKNSVNAIFCITFYFAMYFHPSLNIIRQSMAMSLLFLACFYLINKKYVAYAVTNALACLFHRTAIICFIFFILYVFLRREYAKDRVKFRLTGRRVLFYIVILLCPLIYRLIIPLLLSLPFFSKYSDYAVNINGTIGFGMTFKFIVLIIPVVAVMIHKRGNISAQSLKLLDLYTLFIPISDIGYFIEFTNRLYLYPEILMIVLSSMMIKEEENKKMRTAMVIYYLAFMICVYVNDYLIYNFNETYPLVFV